jgi:heptosyltransferase-2
MVLHALRRAAGRLGAATAEALVWTAARFAPVPHPVGPRKEPRSILILRNNDLGDLLVVTPLFEALRRRYPAAAIVAAVGRWNVATLRHNPYISEVLVTNAPWFNKFVPRQTVPRILAYIAFSAESKELARRAFDIGIDVLGSPWGSLLLLRARIPLRLGVHGYAGGHTGVDRWVDFDPQEEVGRSALRFAELLGATELPPCRPQIFLTPAERWAGEQAWRRVLAGRQGLRVVVAPAGGLPGKCWPPASYAELAARLAAVGGLGIAVTGGPQDLALGNRLAAAAPGVVNLAGHLSLRETFALVAAADLVLCNSSVLMHAAAAFAKPTFVLLGRSFPSALQHDAQWGYPGLCRSLGREPGERADLYLPAEVMALIVEHLEGTVRRPESPCDS